MPPTNASQSSKFHRSSTNAFGLGSSGDRGFGGSSGGTRLKFSGFGLGGSGGDDGGMADCRL